MCNNYVNTNMKFIMILRTSESDKLSQACFALRTVVNGLMTYYYNPLKIKKSTESTENHARERRNSGGPRTGQTRPTKLCMNDVFWRNFV